jgi:hypothetical protein
MAAFPAIICFGHVTGPALVVLHKYGVGILVLKNLDENATLSNESGYLTNKYRWMSTFLTLWTGIGMKQSLLTWPSHWY